MLAAAGGAADLDRRASTTSASPTPTPTPTPEPLAWGPTEDELAQARETVAGWTPEQLAGGVLVPRYDGTDPATPADAGPRAAPRRRDRDGRQRRRRRAGHRHRGRGAAGGGRRRPHLARRGDGRPGGRAGRPAEEPGRHRLPDLHVGRRRDRRGTARGDEAAAAAVVTEAASATGLQLRGLGFTWVFAPDADVTIGPQDPTIGSRSPSDDPAHGRRPRSPRRWTATSAAGIVAVAKHYPGHGTWRCSAAPTPRSTRWWRCSPARPPLRARCRSPSAGPPAPTADRPPGSAPPWPPGCRTAAAGGAAGPARPPSRAS